MCRIAGIVNHNANINLLEHQVKQMCSLQKHGGPDDDGIYSNPDCKLVLGHRRLALLDLTTAGHQPMHYLERYTITYNGEIYNFKELRKTLESLNYIFNTNTDTEVILAAYAHWGENAFQMFNGMFAFVLFDNVEKKVFLVRDASGIKPMYYSNSNGALFFASEMNAMSSIEDLNNINNDAPIYQLAYGFLPEPITTLKNVKPLPKGTYLSYHIQSNVSSLKAFSFYSFSNKITDYHVAKTQISKTLNNAVNMQMVSDAPIGVFLSGGIDSAIIANLAKKHTSSKIHTLSVYFNEEKFSEKKYQDIVANDLDSIHHSILLTENDFINNFDKVLTSMDMPSCDGINTWFISKYASEVGLKAVLSGIGADELFGGYPSFERMEMVKYLQSLPNIALKAATKFAHAKYNRISYLQIPGIRGAYLFLRGYYTPNQIAKQLGTYEKEVWDKLNEMPTSPFLNCDNKNKASWLEINMYMQDQLLRDADVMSMTHGLEIRVPFLDHELINTAYSINSKIKYTGKLPKALLINSFENILQNQVWNRPKMGFSFPFSEWLKKCEQFKNLESSKNFQTKLNCNDFKRNKIHWSKIMSLIVLKHKFENSNI